MAEKTWASLDEQVAILTRRGLANTADFRDELSTIGYYRLGGYTYPLRKLAPDGYGRRRLSSFVADASMRDALNLYWFDERLRQATWIAVSKLEICLRVDVGYVLGELDPYLHLHVLDYWPSGAMRTRAKAFLSRLEKSQARPSEDFIKHYASAHGGRLPVWVAAEILEFGQLVTLYSLAPFTQRQENAQLYDTRADELESWMRSINFVRNICAHHARLWNRQVVISPLAKYRKDDIELGSALANTSRAYATLSLIAFLLRRGDFNEETLGIKDALLSFPENIPQVSINQVGMNATWANSSLWHLHPSGNVT